MILFLDTLLMRFRCSLLDSTVFEAISDGWEHFVERKANAKVGEWLSPESRARSEWEELLRVKT